MSIENASGFVAFDAIDTIPDPRVSAALESIVAQMNAMLAQQHNGDGSHANVTFALGSATAYLTGTGIWMGQDTSQSTAPWQFRVGNPSGDYLAWNGSALTVSGSITVTGGNAAKRDLSNVTGNYAASTSVGGPATRVVGSLAAAPSGAGLYLGSDYLGYYNGSAWKTYMDNTGQLFLGSPVSGNGLSWTGTTLTAAFASGNVSLDSTGITVAPDTSPFGVVAGKAYRFGPVSGGTSMALYGAQWSATGPFSAGQWANLKTVGANTTTMIEAVNGSYDAQVLATADTTAVSELIAQYNSGAQQAAVLATATSSTSTIQLSATATTVSGSFGRGTAAAGNAFYSLDVSTNGVITLGGTGTGSNTHAQFYNANGAIGSISSSGSATAYNTSSDARLKTDLGLASDLSGLRATRIHDFAWKASGEVSRGVFAQEAQAAMPHVVTVDDDRWMVDYSKFVPDLIVGWQAHETRLAALEAACKK